MLVTQCIILHIEVYVVEDDEVEYNVIRVHYYQDEGDDTNADNMVEIVKDQCDGNAYI